MFSSLQLTLALATDPISEKMCQSLKWILPPPSEVGAVIAAVPSQLMPRKTFLAPRGDKCCVRKVVRGLGGGGGA